MNRLLIAVFFFCSIAPHSVASEVQAPLPSKTSGQPWTDEDRLHIFIAQNIRAIMRTWGLEKFKSIHNLSCIVKISRDGTVNEFKQNRLSKDPNVNRIFFDLIKGIKYDTRVLGPMDSVTVEIKLETYPNSTITRASGRKIE